MSLDLKVFFGEPSNGFIERWNAALQRRGVPAQAFADDDWRERGELFLCPANSLFEPGTEGYADPGDSDLIEVGGFSRHELANESGLAPASREKLRRCQYTAHIGARDGAYFNWQVSALPAMVEALDGVLFDPQLISSEALRAVGRDDPSVNAGIFATVEDVELWAEIVTAD
jgi:hypothetical protein